MTKNILLTFCNRLYFYGEEYLAPSPTQKLEDRNKSKLLLTKKLKPN